MTREVRHTCTEMDHYDLQGPVVDVIKRLQGFLATVPAEVRTTTDIDLEAYDDYGCSAVRATFSYFRLETLAETQERTARENQNKAHRKRQFLLLKKEFGE